MAAIVASYTGDRLVTPLVCLNTPQQRPASVESTWLRMEIEALAGLWSRLHHASSSNRAIRARRDINACARKFHGIKETQHSQSQTYTCQTLDLLPPPSYEESIADLPPDYTGTCALAVVQGLVDVKLDAGLEHGKPRDSQRRSDDKVDLTQPLGIRYHAKKKAKKAANTAQKDKWADDEEKKEETPPDDGAGGGDGGGDGGAGGDGARGDPPGDGGDGNGEDPDDI
ncbi:hypothetical protein Q7P37_001399 [Cladosporium fusiforme]